MSVYQKTLLVMYGLLWASVIFTAVLSDRIGMQAMYYSVCLWLIVNVLCAIEIQKDS